MSDPIFIKMKHNGLIFQIDQYYNPLPFIEMIENPVKEIPFPDESIGW